MASGGQGTPKLGCSYAIAKVALLIALVLTFLADCDWA